MSRRVLSQRETVALALFAQEHYTASGKTDQEFAEFADEKLGIEGLNDDHVKSIRRSFDIPANAGRVAVKASNDAIRSIEAQVLELLVRIEELDKKVTKLQQDFHLKPPGRGL